MFYAAVTFELFHGKEEGAFHAPPPPVLFLKEYPINWSGSSHSGASSIPVIHYLESSVCTKDIINSSCFSLSKREWITDTASPSFNAKQAKRIIHCCYRHHRSALDNGIGEIILSRLANYFRCFSDEYIAMHGEDSLNDNNWYEFVKYGTMDKAKMVPEKDWLSLGIGKLYTEESK